MVELQASIIGSRIILYLWGGSPTLQFLSCWVVQLPGSLSHHEPACLNVDIALLLCFFWPLLLCGFSSLEQYLKGKNSQPGRWASQQLFRDVSGFHSFKSKSSFSFVKKTKGSNYQAYMIHVSRTYMYVYIGIHVYIHTYMCITKVCACGNRTSMHTKQTLRELKQETDKSTVTTRDYNNSQKLFLRKSGEGGTEYKHREFIQPCSLINMTGFPEKRGGIEIS